MAKSTKRYRWHDWFRKSQDSDARRWREQVNLRMELLENRILLAADLSLNLGTVSDGQSVNIQYDAVVDNPFPKGLDRVWNQADVSGSNIITTTTNPIFTPVDRAPQIDAVFANGTGWDPLFRAEVGDATFGYQIPDGSNQLDILPWVDIDEISIRFTEQVDIQLVDLTLQSIDPITVAPGGFSYDLATDTATWLLTTPIGSNKVRLIVDGTSAGAVTDIAGNQALDGEWNELGTAVFNSGDGVAGGDFNFRFNVQPADVTGEGNTTVTDLVNIASKVPSAIGNAAYNVFFDVNGSGDITVTDLVNASANVGTTQPGSEPGGGAASGWAADATEPTAPGAGSAGDLDMTKIANLIIDVDGDGVADPGDTIHYTVTVTNNSGFTALNVVFEDCFHPNLSLVAGSVNASPIAQDDSFTMLEDGVLPGNVLSDNGNGADSDPDGDPLTVNTTPVSDPTNGILGLLSTGDFTYSPFQDVNGSDMFEYEIDDGNGQTDTATVSIIITPVNDQPSFTAVTPAAVLEDAGAQTVIGWSSFSPGPANESGQSVLQYIVSNVSNASLFAAGPLVDASGNLSFTSAADAFGTSTFDVQVQDDGGTANGGVDLSEVQTFTITVDAVNDQPSFTASDPPAVDQDSGSQTVLGWATFDPGPANESGQTVLQYIVSNISNSSLFSAGPTVNTSGDLSYTSETGAFGTSTFDVQVQDDGGTANGGVDLSAIQTFTITVNQVITNQPPTANPDFYDTIGNVGIDVSAANGVLDNDTDPDTGDTKEVIEVNGVAANVGVQITLGSGALLQLDSDGSFTYETAPGITGSDTFMYTMQDSGGLTSTTFVGITINDTIWFIDDTGSGSNLGTLNNPFLTLAAFEKANGGGDANDPEANDCIFVHSGNYTAPLTLENGQIVVGQGAGDTIDNICNLFIVPTNTNPLPTTGGTSPVLTSAGNGINLADGNTIRGLNIGNTTGTGISGTGVGTSTVSDVSITGTGAGVNINTGTLAMSFDEISSSNAAGITLSGVGGDFDVTTGTINSGNSTAVNISGNPVDLGISLTSVSATGATNGIRLNNTTGSFTVTGDGGGTQNASGGTILNATGDGVSLTSAAGVSLTQLDITDSGDHGININSVTNFTYQDAILDGVGANNDEHSVIIVNLFGTSLIEDVDFDNINEDAIEYLNNSADDGVRDVLTVRRGDFNNHGAAFGENGIDVQASGTALMGLIVDDSDFDINANGSLGLIAQSVGSSNLDLQILSSTFNAGAAFGSGGIQITNAGNSTATNTITDNMVLASDFTPLVVNNDDNAISSATIMGNTLTGNGDIFSHNGRGMDIVQDGNGVQTLLIDDNNISGIIFDAIRLVARDRTSGTPGTGVLNATVTDNTATVLVDTLFLIPFGAGLKVNSQNTNSLNLSATGNTLSGSKTFGPGFQDEDIALDRDGSSTLNVTQLDPSGPADPNRLDTINNNAGVDVDGSVNFNQPDPPLPLLSAQGQGAGGYDALTDADLAVIVSEAISKWELTDLTAQQRASLAGLTFGVKDLPTLYLGQAHQGHIWLDNDAAGWGWFVDATPADDVEFQIVSTETERLATPGSEAFAHMDLLTVVMHEVGHVVGLGHDSHDHSLMAEALTTGARRLVENADHHKGLETEAISKSNIELEALASVIRAIPVNDRNASFTIENTYTQSGESRFVARVPSYLEHHLIASPIERTEKYVWTAEQPVYLEHINSKSGHNATSPIGTHQVELNIVLEESLIVDFGRRDR